MNLAILPEQVLLKTLLKTLFNKSARGETSKGQTGYLSMITDGWVLVAIQPCCLFELQINGAYGLTNEICLSNVNNLHRPTNSLSLDK